MKIATLIVTYNGSKWIEKCIQSVSDSQYKSDIFIFDNHSSDNTINIINTFPNIQFTQSDKNLGFGAANNVLIQKAVSEGYDYIFLLNQDAYLEGNTLGELVEFAENHKDFGIISPLHYNGEGTELDNHFKHYLSLSDEKPDYYNSSFLNAAAWLISKECIKKTGVFHPLFFHYGEDRNYCDRVLYHQFKIGAVKNTKISHDRNQNESFQKSLKNSHIKLLCIFVNPNLSLYKSCFEGLKNVFGISKYYYKKHRSFKFFSHLSSKYLSYIIRTQEFERVKKNYK